MSNEAMNLDIKVAIIHHHGLFREALAYALSRDPTISLCCQISSLDEIPKHWEGPCPDIVLVEMVEASRSALLRVGKLRSECPGCKIIMLDVPANEKTVLACIEIAGAMGYVTEGGSLDDLLHTVRSAMSGETPCPPRVAHLLFARVSELSQQIALARSDGSKSLTRREQAIVSAIEKGLSNKEIAAQLGIEVSTVKNHVHNILDKLKQHNRQAAVRYVKEHGLGAPAR